VSEIQALTLRAEVLGQSVDRWNAAMIGALVFAAFAAVAVVVTTHIALKRAKQLAGVQGRLLQAKDSQLALDLKEKDWKIAEAGTKAATAEEKAENFRLDIAKANERAAEADARAAIATQKAEEEHLARVRIEEKLAGWSITAQDQARLIERLKGFNGTPFDLGADPSEAGFMEVIDSLLLAAKWNRQIPKPDNQLGQILLNSKARINFVSGFFVEYAASKDKEFRPAASVLIDGLRTAGIPAEGQIATNEPDVTAIHIIVGKK
jgi:hypothetical protein